MGVVEIIIKQNARESNWLDFKAKIDFPKNRIDFLRDVMAFANNDYIGKQYIIYGIKENKGQLEVLGLDSASFDELSDEASYQQLISDKIEPRIGISLYNDRYDNKEFVILEIQADKSQRPFMFRVDYGADNHQVYKGEAWIRESSRKDRMNLKDFDNIYNKKNPPLEVILEDKLLFITDNDPGDLDLVIKNHSTITRQYNDVFLVIFDDKGNEKISTRMHGFKTYNEFQKGTNDMNFSLRVPGSTELKGIGKFDLNTSQVAQLGVDEFGFSDINYTFKLYFRDYGKDIEFIFDDCIVNVKSDSTRNDSILRKVKKQNKN